MLSSFMAIGLLIQPYMAIEGDKHKTLIRFLVMPGYGIFCCEAKAIHQQFHPMSVHIEPVQFSCITVEVGLHWKS